MEAKGDWLMNFINDGIFVPHESQSWEQFEEHYGGWFDTNEAPADRAMILANKLVAELSADQLNAVAELVFLAIKSTRDNCRN